MLRQFLGKRVAVAPTLPDGLDLEWSADGEIESDNGSVLRGRGIFFHDARDGSPLAWEARALWETFGIYTFKVAGVSYRADSLRLGSFDVGRRLRLVAEPDNEHDANAIAVYDAGGRCQVGYVPRDRTAHVRACTGTHRDAAAIVFHEWCLLDGRRCALRALTAPEAVVAAIADRIALAAARTKNPA